MIQPLYCSASVALAVVVFSLIPENLMLEANQILSVLYIAGLLRLLSPEKELFSTRKVV